MRKLRSILSIVLVLCMLLSTIPVATAEETTVHNITIEANGVVFRVDVTGTESSWETGSCDGAMSTGIASGKSLTDVGVIVSHDTDHEAHLIGWQVLLPVEQNGEIFFAPIADENGNELRLTTAEMLTYPIVEDTTFVPVWNPSHYTSFVWLTVHGEGQFDLTYVDDGGQHTNANESYDSFPAYDPGASFTTQGIISITDPVHPDGLAFDGWYVYFRGPADAEYNTTPLNDVDANGNIIPLTTAQVLAYTNTRVGYTDFIAKFAGVDIDPNGRNDGNQGGGDGPNRFVIINTNNGSPFTLHTNDSSETVPGYMAENIGSAPENTLSEFGITAIDLDTSTEFACWQVLRPVFDADGTVLEWLPDTDEQGNAIILPDKDLILTWPINDGVMFLADWITGGNTLSVNFVADPVTQITITDKDGNTATGMQQVTINVEPGQILSDAGLLDVNAVSSAGALVYGWDVLVLPDNSSEPVQVETCLSLADVLNYQIQTITIFRANYTAPGDNSSGVPGESAPSSGGLGISSDGTFDIYRTNPQNGQIELWGDDASHTREDMDVYVGDTLADFGITDITDIKYWDGKREFLGWEAWSYLPFEMQGETHYLWGLLYNRLFTTQEMLTYPAEDKYIEFVAVWAGDDADYFTNVHFNATGGTFLVTAYDYTEEGPVVLGTIPMDGSRIEGCKENGQSVKEQFDASYYPNTDPVHEGYTFEGWLAVYEDQYWHEMSDKLYTTEQVVNLPVPKENVQYLAKWKEISMEEYRFGNPYFPYDGSYSELYYLANGGTFNVTVNFDNGSPHSYSSPYIIYTTDSSLTFEESQQQGVVQRTFELADKTNFEGWTTYQADQIFMVAIKKGDKLNVLGENFTVFKAGDEKYEDENGDFIQSEVYVLLKNAKVYSTTMTPEDALNLKGDKFYATVAQWHVASSTLANVKSATCTAEGYTGDKVCANCGEILEKGKVIAKTAHTEVTVASKAPTCTETGLTEGKKCSVCGTVTVEQTVIAAASHKLTKVAAVTPTYTAGGNIEHYVCACGALFADAEGKTATTAEAVKLAQLIKIEETKAEISTNAVDTAIKESEATGSITIDLVEVADEEATKPESGSGSDTTTKPAPVISSAALPVASLQKVAEISEEATLTVNMTEVTVTMDAKTLAAVAEQSAGETVTLKVEKIETKALTEEQQAVIEDKEVAVVVSATLISNNVAISDFNGGEVTIALPFTLPEGTEGSDFQVYYVADDGTMTAHDTAYKNGCLVFSTTHFSDYVVVNTAVSAPADPTVPNTGDQSHLLFFTTLLMISAAGIYLASRKMRRA